MVTAAALAVRVCSVAMARSHGLGIVSLRAPVRETLRPGRPTVDPTHGAMVQPPVGSATRNQAGYTRTVPVNGSAPPGGGKPGRWSPNVAPVVSRLGRGQPAGCGGW